MSAWEYGDIIRTDRPPCPVCQQDGKVVESATYGEGTKQTTWYRCNGCWTAFVARRTIQPAAPSGATTTTAE